MTAGIVVLLVPGIAGLLLMALCSLEDKLNKEAER